MAITKRVLCLHGRRQCGLTFAKKLFPEHHHAIASSSPVVTLDIGRYSFVFPNAPFSSQPDLPKGFKPKAPRPGGCPPSLFSWWGEKQAEEEDDGSRALQVVHDLRGGGQEEEFVGVIGFSQGGALAASLCRKSSSTKSRVIPLEFAVFLSSYYVPPTTLIGGGGDAFVPPRRIRFNDDEDDEFDSSRVRRTLHCFSDHDQVVHSARSQALLDWTTGGERHVVTGGHAVPSIGQSRLLPWLLAASCPRLAASAVMM